MYEPREAAPGSGRVAAPSQPMSDRYEDELRSPSMCIGQAQVDADRQFRSPTSVGGDSSSQIDQPSHITLVESMPMAPGVSVKLRIIVCTE